MKLLDYGVLQDFTNHGVNFPAQKWRNESLENLKIGGTFSPLAYSIIRPILQRIIQENDSIYKEKVCEFLD